MSENEVGSTEETTTSVEEVAKQKRVRTDTDTFIEAWEETVAGLLNGSLTGNGIDLVAARLGLKKTSVSQRATKFRQTYGVPLSKMPKGGGARFNAEAANAKLAEIQAKLTVDEETETDAEG